MRTKIYFFSLFSICLLFFSPAAFAQTKIKIACVGNSITAGWGLPNAGADSYPAVLQKYLGTDKYEVRNFGASGRVLSKSTEAEGNSYWRTGEYQNALKYEPDIVIIKLGTNDAEPWVWNKYGAQFKATYIDMVNSFKNLPSNPEIIACCPLPMGYPTWVNNQKNLVTGVIPCIKEAAQATGATVIDLQTPFEGKPYLTPDLAHPDEKGAMFMANIIAKVVCPECNVPDLPENIFIHLSSFDYTDKSINNTSSVTGLEMTPLFDNDAKTGISIPFTPGNETQFAIELEDILKVSAYSITSGNSTDGKNNPKSWVLQGGSGTRWQTVDEQKDLVFMPNETKVFLGFSTLSVKQYRLLVKDNNGGDQLEIKEWQVFGSPQPLKADITGNGGTITDQYNITTGDNAQMLIDQKADTKYVASGKGTTCWIQYDSPKPVQISKYALTSANDAPGRDPVSWKLEGKVGARWEILDTQTNQEFVGRFSTLEYPVSSSRSYDAFKLTITNIKTGNTFQLAEWQLFEKKTSAIVSVDNTFYNIYARNNSIYINSNVGEMIKYEIFNLHGQCLSSGNVLPHNDNKITEKYTNGIYLVSLTSVSGNKVVVKVIV